MIFAGIDAGSRAIKIALCDESKKILSSTTEPDGFNLQETIQFLIKTNKKIKKPGF